MLRKSFDIARSFRRVTQSYAQTLDRVIEAVVEIHKGVCRPDTLLDYFARHYFAGMLQENPQDLERLVLKFDLYAPLAHFAGLQIDLEHAEANGIRGGRANFFHRSEDLSLRESLTP